MHDNTKDNIIGSASSAGQGSATDLTIANFLTGTE